MGTPYVGEIRLFAGNFAPLGWEFCDGRSLAISEYEVLFNLIGTIYGGDGQSTFNVPDLRGRVPVHQGPQDVIGSRAGVESVTLATAQIPAHRHAMVASTSVGNVNNAGASVLAVSASIPLYVEDGVDSALAATSVQPVGGNQPHENMQPFLALNFIISLYGIYPSPT